jgi:pyruvate-formate lyase-activating enzyme
VGFNDFEKDVKEIAHFAIRLSNILKVELLTYHRMEIDNHKKLGRRYERKANR